MSVNGEKNAQKMTGSAQTMLTWVKELDSKEDIPQYYLENIQKSLLSDPFPYTLLVPPLKNQRNKPAERLLVLLGSELHVFEKRSRKIIPDKISLNPSVDLEIGNALLYSWVTLRDTKQKTQPHIITIPFNTATGRYFDPIIQLIKPISIAQESSDFEQGSMHQNLKPADFKFNAFARECITKNTRVINSLWQPPLQKKVLKIFGKTFYQNVTMAHYLILTSQELIMLWDDENSVENRGVRYGGIRRFIPHSLISDMNVIKTDNIYCKLNIKMISGETIEQIFLNKISEQLNQFIIDFKNSIMIH
jgi:hypothetical protein